MAKKATKTTEAPMIDKKHVTDSDIDLMIRKMGDAVRKEPRMTVFIHADPSMDASEPQFVSINGYPFWIPRGREVSVPYSVYTVLQQQGVVR